MPPNLAALSNATGEIDVYGGFAKTIDDWTFDVGFLQFIFPGGKYDPSGESLNTLELNAAVTWKFIQLKYSYAVTDYFGFSKKSFGADSDGSDYIELNANYEFMPSWIANVHVGHQKVKNYDDYDFTDWKVGVTKNFEGGWQAAVAYVDEYYYRLDTSLLVKSGLMAISGGVLLALRHALPAPDRSGEGVAGRSAEPLGPIDGEGGASKARSGLRFGVVAAFALVVGVSGQAVVDRERVLDEGRVVLFELAPVDPRSLMQGDYMALRFALDDALPRRDGRSAAPLLRFAYLDVDTEGRARLAGVGEELPVPSASVAVRIRMRDGAPSVGPNAFFFQEGLAAAFEGARWGEFRVAADGTALLTHLRDEKLQRLGAPRP